MRRFIAAITDTIASCFGIGLGGQIVTSHRWNMRSMALPNGRAALRLRGLYIARTLLVRLTGRMPARLPVVSMCHARPADPGVAPVLTHHCLSTSWAHRGWRPVGSGARCEEF